MSKSTDERGRLYLPKDVRDRFGETYRIVELPSHVALFPVDDDPFEGLREAVGDAFEGTDSDELKQGEPSPRRSRRRPKPEGRTASVEPCTWKPIF